MRLVHAVFASLIIVPSAVAQTQLSAENAYNPIPSPDGKKIVAVRTGWFRPGGSGGLGRSNLQSSVIVLDRTGHTLTTLTEGFVADWKKEGVVSFRDWSYSLLSEDGSSREGGRTCPPEILPARASECMERVAYLSTLGNFVWVRQNWVRQKWLDSVLFRLAMKCELESGHPQGDFSAYQCLASGPSAVPPSTSMSNAIQDHRRLALGPLAPRTLTIRSIGKFEMNFGPKVIHPDADWTWMEPSWNPVCEAMLVHAHGFLLLTA